MTPDEWNQSHPSQCQAYINTWTEKQKREEVRHAHLMLVIAQSQGVKISGRKPKLDDFLPDYAKPKKAKRTPQETEAALKAAFKIIARQQPPTTTDGKS